MQVRALARSDVDGLVAAFAAAHWPGKSPDLYQHYLAEQAAGERVVLVAEHPTGLAGYACVIWRSGYEPFQAGGVPEIVDLNVLPWQRRQGVGTALLDAAEATIAARSTVAGIGCGLYADYGAALRLYLKRGYLPDGRGIAYDGRTVAAGALICVDDSAALMLTKPLQPTAE